MKTQGFLLFLAIGFPAFVLALYGPVLFTSQVKLPAVWIGVAILIIAGAVFIYPTIR